MSGEICLHEHLWGPSPFLVWRGAEVARRADRDDAHEGFTLLRAARMRKTLLLLCGLYCVLARGRRVLQYTRAANETERKWPPPHTLRMGLLLYAKWVTNRWQCRQGQNWKSVVLGTAACTVLSYLTLMAGDKGIKCPSGSPKQCRKGTVRGATVCHDG